MKNQHADPCIDKHISVYIYIYVYIYKAATSVCICVCMCICCWIERCMENAACFMVVAFKNWQIHWFFLGFSRNTTFFFFGKRVDWSKKNFFFHFSKRNPPRYNSQKKEEKKIAYLYRIMLIFQFYSFIFPYYTLFLLNIITLPKIYFFSFFSLSY